jgi:hypothetical protein
MYVWAPDSGALGISVCSPCCFQAFLLSLTWSQGAQHMPLLFVSS